ncbi:hypothetical protein [Dokdonella sp.]|uniref:hypothetical protein n=1 Tax=Dokdonella sp. TaxID=2291710 RepID=UPI003528E35F
MLTAFQNVADASARAGARCRALPRAAALEATADSLAIARRQYEDGSVGYLQVLIESRLFEQARVLIIEARANRCPHRRPRVPSSAALAPRQVGRFPIDTASPEHRSLPDMQHRTKPFPAYRFAASQAASDTHSSNNGLRMKTRNERKPSTTKRMIIMVGIVGLLLPR